MNTTERRKAIGKNLQQLRKKAGYKSANAFAEAIGINPKTYTGYEHGRGAFSIERAWDIADALNCSLDDLVGRKFPTAEYGNTLGERQLIDSYRLMDESSREKFSDLAGTFVVASEKDGPGARSDVERFGVNLDGRNKIA